jgi:SAM-dependent methyltransferase
MLISHRVPLREHVPCARNIDVVACLHCDMVYVASALPANEVTGYYQAGAKYASTSWARDSAAAPRLTAAANRIVPLAAGGLVVDIGCAGGELLHLLRARGCNVLGIDPSPDCVQACRDRGLSAELGEIGPGLAAGMKGSARVVVLNHVLEHLLDPLTALTQAATLLDPFGCLYAEVPDASKFYRYVHAPYSEVNHEHVNLFSPRSLARSGQLAGLTLVDDAEDRAGFTPGFAYPVAAAVFQARAPGQVLFGREYHQFILEYDRISDAWLTNMATVLHGERLPVWGAGQMAATLLGRIPELATALVDTNERLHGSRWWPSEYRPPLTVQSPDVLAPGRRVLIASTYYQAEIEADCRRRGLLPVTLPRMPTGY